MIGEGGGGRGGGGGDIAWKKKYLLNYDSKPQVSHPVLKMIVDARSKSKVRIEFALCLSSRKHRLRGKNGAKYAK